MQPKFEAAVRTPMKRASKRAPTRYSWPLASRSLWSYDDPIPMALSYGHKDLEPKGQLYQVGAHFEALFMGVLTAVSNLGCIFFVS